MLVMELDHTWVKLKWFEMYIQSNNDNIRNPTHRFNAMYILVKIYFYCIEKKQLYISTKLIVKLKSQI